LDEDVNLVDIKSGEESEKSQGVVFPLASIPFHQARKRGERRREITSGWSGSDGRGEKKTLARARPLTLDTFAAQEVFGSKEKNG